MKSPLYKFFGPLAACVLVAGSGCEITSQDREIISDAVDPTHPTAPPAPTIPVAQIPACHVERFTQPAAVVTEKLDLLLVVDTSGSLNAERGKLADAMDAFVRALPSTVDYRIGIMPAHGPHSQWAGKLFRRNKNEAWILDSKAMSLATIQSELRDRLTKQSEIPNDSKSDGGEMGIYSLLRALDTDRVTLARSQGFFRTDASLVPVLMSDENDICTAVYPVGVIPVPDPQGAEKKAKQNDCGGVTNQALALKLAAHMGSRPYVTAGVIYNSLATVPKVDENEFGYGYFEFVQMTNGITIDMADANYRTGMEALGNRAAVKMNLKSDFTLARGGLSAASLVVAVDGIEVPYTLNDSGGAAQVVLGSLGLPGSVVDVTYCVAGADTVSPVLDITKPANGGLISRDLRPVSGLSNEALSSVTVAVGSGQAVALSLAGDRLSFSGSVDFGSPGVKQLTWTALDMAGNRRRVMTSVTVSADVTAPVLSHIWTVPSYTNQANQSVSFNVTDESSAVTRLLRDGVVVAQSGQKTGQFLAVLVEGENLLTLESEDQLGLKTAILLSSVTLDTVPPAITVTPSDGASVQSGLQWVEISASEPIISASANGTSLQSTGSASVFRGQILFPSSGDISIQWIASDRAGNTAQRTTQALIQSSNQPPQVIGVPSQPVLTRNSQISFSLSVIDDSQVTSSVFLNGQKILETMATAFSPVFQLLEGPNSIRVESRDSLGLVTTLDFPSVTRDSIRPEVLEFTPAFQDTLKTFTFPIHGVVNEPLQSGTVMGAPLTLSADGLQFSATVTVEFEGAQEIPMFLTDLAGNTALFSPNVNIVPSRLNIDLVTVTRDPEQLDKLIVSGVPGAAYPESQITIRLGAFTSSVTTFSLADGSFSVKTPLFETAVLEIIFETHELRFQSGATILSGVVRDTNDRPLPGVRVSVVGHSEIQPVHTSASGAFSIQNVVTGDQTVHIDGRNASDPCTQCGSRRFSETNLKVTLGIGQTNALQRPVYLPSVPNDGSEVQVSVSAGGVVSSVHAPGIQLTIPAGSIVGSENATVSISMALIDSEKSVTQVPQFAVPDKVINLEPSGLRFSERVELTVPNENELPAGAEVLVMSFDSATGAWAPDAVGQVTSDGSLVRTKPGLGISHFSQVYVTPNGPTVTQMGAQDKRGADTFDGALVTSVTLPSYKALGADISPKLIYNSRWAKPGVTVTNLLSIPAAHFEARDVEGQSLFQKALLFLFGSPLQTGFYQIIPEKIEATFQTTGLLSEKMTVTGVPRNAAMSFHFDLGHLSSGVYPYQSHWDIHLKHIRIATVQPRVKKFVLFGPLVDEGDAIKKDLSFRQYFPDDFGGQLYVVNKTQSEAGRGWKIQGPARIVNPSEDRLMLEESDGSVSSYAIENSISTVFNTAVFSNATLEMKSISFIRWPYLFVERLDFPGSGMRVPYVVDLRTNTPANSIFGAGLPYITQQDRYAGTIVHKWQHQEPCGFGSICTIPAHIQLSYNIPVPPSAWVVPPDNSHFYALSAQMHLLGRAVGRISVPPERYIGQTMTPPQSIGGTENPDGIVSSLNAQYCVGVLGVNCSISGLVQGHQISSSGPFPVSGLAKEGTDGSHRTNLLLNSPKGLTYHPFKKVITIADTGNHRVVEVNTDTNAVVRVAGNMQTTPKTDGGPAIESSLVRPVAVTYDSLGQLYILTDEGYVRKVDLTGSITTIGGLPWTSSAATLANQGDSLTFALRKPTNLALDETNAVLYVSDTGNNRVVAFDVSVGGSTARTVAGDSVAGFNGDQRSALNAHLNEPTVLALDDDKNLLIVDSKNELVRRVVFNRSVVVPLSFAPSSQDNSVITKNIGTGGFTRLFRDGSFQIFSSSGYEASSSSRLGRTVAYTYDGNNRLIRQTDPVGGFIQYSYSAGKLESISDHTNRTTTLQYSGDYLTKVLMPESTTREFRYHPDGSGRMQVEINENEYSTEYVYNDLGRLAKVIRPDTSEIVLSDFASGTMINSYTSGNVGQVEPKDQNSKANEVSDPRNIRVSMKPDKSGYISEIRDSLGLVTKIDRNAKGQPLVIYKDFKDNGTPEDDRDDSFESKVTFTYNAFGDLLTKVDSATGHTEVRTYNDFGQVLTEKSITGVTVTHTYDPVTGLETATSDSVSGSLGSVAYVHPLKLPTRKTDVYGKFSDFTYDPMGNLETQETPIDSNRKAKVFYTRDDAGNILTAKNPNGDVTTYRYDLWNRLIEVTSAENEKTEYAYSNTGKLTQVKDAKQNIVTYMYNELDQLTRKTTQVVNRMGQVVDNTFTYGYDDSGNMDFEKDPNGNEKYFTYNTRNQIEKKVLPDDQYDYGYNDQGNLTSLTNQNYAVGVTYDIEGRLVESIHSRGKGSKSSHPDVTLSFGYDDFDRRQTMTTPSGTIAYGYDAYSRLSSISNQRSEIFTFEYDLLGRESKRTRPGSQTVLSFDDGSFLKTITHSGTSGGTLSAVVGYDRDLSGLRTGVNRSGVSNLVLSYDRNQQLTSSSSTNPSLIPNEAYEYDEIQNRTLDQGGSYTYDQKSQQLTEDYRSYYFYDDNGNLISKQAKGLTGEVTSFAYTSENQLKWVKVYAPGAPQQSFYVIGSSVPVKEIYYFYDPMGRRVEKQVIDHQNSQNAQTRRYVYDGQDLITEMDESNQVLASYTHRLNQSEQVIDDVLSVNVTSAGQAKGLAQASGSYHYIKDGLGSVTEVTNSGGYLVQRVLYATFGKILSIRDASANDITNAPALKSHFAFTGREFDEETGNYYYRARYYDSNVGRFLQKDPDPGTREDPVTIIGSYLYAANAPHVYGDPSGRVLFIFALVGLVSAGINIVDHLRAEGGFRTPAEFFGILTSGFVGGFIGALATPVLGPVAAAMIGASITTVGNHYQKFGAKGFEGALWSELMFKVGASSVGALVGAAWVGKALRGADLSGIVGKNLSHALTEGTGGVIGAIAAAGGQLTYDSYQQLDSLRTRSDFYYYRNRLHPR